MNKKSNLMWKQYYKQLKETLLQVLQVHGVTEADCTYQGKKLHVMVSRLIQTAKAVSANRTADDEEKQLFDSLEAELATFFEEQIEKIEGVY